MQVCCRFLIALFASAAVAESSHAQSRLPACGVGDEWAEMLRSRVVLFVSTQDEPHERLRTALGVDHRASDSVSVVADSATCARAVSVLDGAMAVRLPGFVPKAASERVLYIVRIGAGQHVVRDTDRRLVSGSYGTLWWFTGDLGQLLTVSVY